jgi:uncharacterized protein with PIN domain
MLNEFGHRPQESYMKLQRAPRLVLCVASLLWSAAVVAGFLCVLKYETTPGNADEPPLSWPLDSAIHPKLNQANLVFAVHPRCPCTRASINEFAELLAKHSGEIAAHVLVYRPENGEIGWERTDHWRRLEAIRDTSIRPDEDGMEAKRFGLLSSGHVLLYDKSGRLRFSGGLTNARGHAGKSLGRNAIAAILEDNEPEQTKTHIYGCSLLSTLAPSSERCSQCRE